MAVKVKEKKIKLQTFFIDESSGREKRKTVTISNIDPDASLDNLYMLAQDLNPLVYGDFTGATRVVGEQLTNLE